MWEVRKKGHGRGDAKRKENAEICQVKHLPRSKSVMTTMARKKRRELSYENERQKSDISGNEKKGVCGGWGWG